jgi:hypothetical protein
LISDVGAVDESRSIHMSAASSARITGKLSC